MACHIRILPVILREGSFLSNIYRSHGTVMWFSHRDAPRQVPDNFTSSARVWFIDTAVLKTNDETDRTHFTITKQTNHGRVTFTFVVEAMVHRSVDTRHHRYV